nr:GspH/FimT family pseudopilin [Alteromonas pelagimontana]
MTTVAILAILMTIGAPGIQRILQQNSVTADINNLSAAARFARFTAIDEEVEVTLCPTADFSQCTADWQQNKMVFVDSNANGSRDANEPVLSTADAVSKGNSIAGISSALLFSAHGGIDQALTVTVCPSGGSAKDASALITSLYGRIAVAIDSDNNDIKESSSGADLSCS